MRRLILHGVDELEISAFIFKSLLYVSDVTELRKRSKNISLTFFPSFE